MKSSKWMIGLVAVVLVLALAPSSFAQVQLQLFNTPSAGEIATNHNANTADVTSVGAGLLVSGQLIAASALTTTQLILTFPGPITTSAAALDGTFVGAVVIAPQVTTDSIRIVGATGLFASVSAVASVNYLGGTITITLPGFPACLVASTAPGGIYGGCNPPGGNGISGSFRITGIRLDVAGKTAPLAISSASLSSSANNYIGPTSLPTLISALGAGLGNFSQATVAGGSNLGTALLFANGAGAPADPTASVLLTEGFATAWRNATQTSTTGTGADVTNGSNILLTIAGLPAGVTANLSRVIIGSATTQVGVALTNATMSVAGGLTTTLSFSAVAGASCGPATVGACQNGGTVPDLTAVESIAFDVVLSGAPTTLPLTAGATVTLAATMTPNSTSGLTAGVPSVSVGVPRFSTLSTTVTIGSIGSATTTLLVPYAVRIAPQYEMGLAVANTTKDPFAGAGGATQSVGTLVYNLFPRSITGTTGGAGTQTTIATSGTVRPGFNGGGLDASGALAAGGTWTASLSELMTAGGVTGDFIGYIFIQANFVDAHGVSYIMENGKISSAAPMLVLAPPSLTSRNVTGAESLGF